MADDTRASLARFDELAQAYEGWFATRLGALVSDREKGLLVSLLQPRAGERILEVGSGTGHFLREIAGYGALCVGIEPSSQMLRVAMSGPLENVGYVRGRGESLPFRDGAFDGLLYMTTLEFVPDIDAALLEAARVVSSEGRMFCGVLNAEGPWAHARRREGGLWREARFFRPAELEALLRPFGDVRIAYCVHAPPQLGWLPGPLLRLADRVLQSLFPARGALIAALVSKAGRP